MKTALRFGTLPLLLALAHPAFCQPPELPQVSPHATISQTIGITDVTVSYSRPSVKGRRIWGDLVPYGFTNPGFGTATAAPWRAGANMNTTVGFEHDVSVAGHPLPAGVYGLHMAIAQSGTVTVIFSRDASSWGSFFYNASRDALRVDVKWEDIPFREQLAYEFNDVTEDSAYLALEWEKKRIPIPLKVDTLGIVTAHLKDELRTATGFQFQSWIAASDFLLTHNHELDLALQWADYAISGPFVGERNFATLSNKAAILNKLGRTAEADALVDEALAMANPLQIHQIGRQLIAEKRPERALDVFKKNAELHPGQWPVNYGLARGYSAMGDHEKALEFLLKAKANVPEGDTLNPPAIDAAIEKAKKHEDIN